MDTITLTAVAREIEEWLIGGRVQAVLQPDEQSLVLEIYNRGERQQLLASADTNYPRIHLLQEKARRGVQTDTPFLLLVRKYLRGAKLDYVLQPAWERVLHLRFSHPEEGSSTLVGEIMGRWSNLLLLTPEGTILEALRRFGPGESRYRVILPGKPYVQPPPQTGKQPIDLVDLPFLERLFNQTPAKIPLWRALIQNVGGMSPLAAREIIYRGTGETQAEVTHPNARPQSINDVLNWYRSLPQQGGWSPSVALDPDDDIPTAFAPYELSHLPILTYYPGISQAAVAFYTASLSEDSYAGRRKQVQTLLDQAERKLMGKRASLGEQAASDEEVDELRGFGEWILAYAWQVQPGDTQLLADTGETVITIPLDPTLTASENAQAYFARYKKAKRAASQVPAILAEVDRDLAYLDQLQTDLILADNAPQIEELREALYFSGLVSEARKGKRQPMRRSYPLRLQSEDGFTVIVGRNALQNEQVTWKQANPEDVWLHARDIPGSHVLIKTNGLSVPQRTLEQAASWAAYHSKARNDTKVSVLYTQRRHLRRIKGARPGQVRVLQSKTITVEPKPPSNADQTFPNT